MYQLKPEVLEVTSQKPLFLTSDLHFFHKRIVEFTDRKKYTTVDEHTEWLINTLNNSYNLPEDSSVTPITLHLGDMFFSSTNEEAIEVLSQLKGDWWFILGNHDNPSKIETVVNTVNKLKGTNHRVLGWYYRFNLVQRNPNKSQKDYKKLLVLCHFPIESWEAMGYNSYMIHGHMHGLTFDYHSETDMRIIPNRLDVGLDASYNFYGKHTIMSFEDVRELLIVRNDKSKS